MDFNNIQKQSLVQLKALMTHLPDFIFFKDLDSRFILVNQAMSNAYGVEKPEDMVGKSDFDFFSEKSAQHFKSDDQDLILGRKTQINTEEFAYDKEGCKMWYATTKVPFRNEEGEIIGTFGIARDITDIKNSEIKEMLLAKELQQNLLPKRSPTIKDLDIAFHYQAMKDVGGDYFDFFPSTDFNQIGFLMADVSGKGIPASLVMSVMRTAFHFINDDSKRPRDLLIEADDLVSSSLNRGMFVTACYAKYDTFNHKMIASSAGHTPILICRNNGALETLKTPGQPLGLKMHDNSNSRFSETETILNCGDLVLIYTDGLTEMVNEACEIYEEERLYHFTQTHHQLSSQAFKDALLLEHKAFRQKADANDDLAFIVIKIEA